jgi:hypothetical protein
MDSESPLGRRSLYPQGRQGYADHLWYNWKILNLFPIALNEAKVEIRVQFKDVTQGIFKDIARNELVFRIQPSEAIYLKFNAKTPGLYSRAMPTEMDLTYKRRFSEQRIPEAYEALILDCLKGDKSNFVRDDELDVAWKVRNGLFGVVPSLLSVFYGIESGHLLLLGPAC